MRRNNHAQRQSCAETIMRRNNHAQKQPCAETPGAHLHTRPGSGTQVSVCACAYASVGVGVYDHAPAFQLSILHVLQGSSMPGHTRSGLLVRACVRHRGSAQLTCLGWHAGRGTLPCVYAHSSLLALSGKCALVVLVCALKYRHASPNNCKHRHQQTALTRALTSAGLF